MMRQIMWRLGVVLLLIGLIVPLDVAAQDGDLTADQLALLDRVKAARENYLGYTSLVETVYGSQSQELMITLGDNQQSFATITGWERSAQIIREDEGQNIAAEAMATIVNSGSQTGDEDNSRTVVVNAEFRLVNGQTYVLATYGPDTSSDPSLPELPEGWFEVESLADWPVLEVLDFQDLIEQRSAFDDLEAMKDAVADVTLAPGVLEDGTEADAITVTLDAAGVAHLLSMGEPVEQPLANILDSLSPDSGATLTVLLDAENNPYEAVTEMILHATKLDASVFGFEELPEGTTLAFTAVVARRETISQVNEALEPATVPEEKGE